MKIQYVATKKDIQQAWSKRKKAIGFKKGFAKIVDNENEVFAPDIAVSPPTLPKDQMPKIKADDIVESLINQIKNDIRSTLYLRNIYIVGRLNLEGLTGLNGQALPIIRLIQCFFDGGICFEGAHLSELSLKGSQFRVDYPESIEKNSTKQVDHINGKGSTLTNALDLSHIFPEIDPKSEIKKDDHQRCLSQTLTANLSSIKIKGPFTCAFSTFSRFKKFSTTNTLGRYETALSLKGATCYEIAYLGPNLRIFGGIVMSQAHFYGELWLAGGEYSAEFLDCQESLVPTIRFQSVICEKFLILSQKKLKSRFLGDVKFLSCNLKEVIIEDIQPYKSQSEPQKYGYFFFKDTECQRISISQEDENDNNLPYYYDLANIKSEDIYIKNIKPCFDDSIINCKSDFFRLHYSKGQTVKPLSFGNKTISFEESTITNNLDIILQANITSKLQFKDIESHKIKISCNSDPNKRSEILENFNKDSSEICLIEGTDISIEELELQFNTGESQNTSNIRHYDFSAKLVAQNLKLDGVFSRIDLQKSQVTDFLDLKNLKTPTYTLKKSKGTSTPDNNSAQWPDLNLSKMQIGSLEISPFILPTQQLDQNIICYKLGCYREAELVFTEIPKENASNRRLYTAFLSFHNSMTLPEQLPLQIFSNRQIIKLSGKSDIFHTLNAISIPHKKNKIYHILYRIYHFLFGNMHRNTSCQKKLLDISTSEKAREYLVLFCNFTWSNGPFRLISGDLLPTSHQYHNSDLTTISLDPNNHHTKQDNSNSIKREILNHAQIFESRDALKDFLEKNSGGKESIINKLKESLEKSNEDKPNEEDKNEEGENKNYYAIANLIYGNELFIAIFYIEKSGNIDMICDQPICLLNKNPNHTKGLEEANPQSDTLDYFLPGSGQNPIELPEYNLYQGATTFLTGTEKLSEIENILSGFDIDSAKKNIFIKRHKLPKGFTTPEDVTRLAVNINRIALVDLSDSHINFLQDNSGSGWGDTALLQTDRMQINHLVIQPHQSHARKSSQNIQTENLSSLRGYVIRKIKDLFRKKIRYHNILDQLSLSPEQILTQNQKKITYTDACCGEHIKNPHSQRLLWLCRYYNDNHQLSKPINNIDSGTFKQIARLYRQHGHPEWAKTIDIARERQEAIQKRKEVLKGDNLEISTKRRILYFIFWCSIPLIWHLYQQGSVRDLLRIDIFGSFFLSLSPYTYLCILFALTALFWQLITRILLKYILWLVLFTGDYLFRWGFLYGLSFYRPLLLIIGMITIGSIGTYELNKNGFLVIEHVITTATVASNDHTIAPDTPLIQIPRKENISNFEKISYIPCGTSIDPILYALDNFIPLINLDQEERCFIRPFDRKPAITHDNRKGDMPYHIIWTETEWIENCTLTKLTPCFVPLEIIFQHPSTWRFFEALYIILGWAIISTTILTYSAYLRKKTQGSG